MSQYFLIYFACKNVQHNMGEWPYHIDNHYKNSINIVKTYLSYIHIKYPLKYNLRKYNLLLNNFND